MNELRKHVCQRNFLKLLNKMFGKYVVNKNLICLSAHWQKFPLNFFFPLEICLFCLENGHYLMYCWKRLSAPLFLTHYSEFPYTPKYINYRIGKYFELINRSIYIYTEDQYFFILYGLTLSCTILAQFGVENKIHVVDNLCV